MAVNNLNTGVGIQPTIVDAKGDLIAATANDAVNRLAVGTNGQVLVADSGETTGLKWNNPGTVGGLVHIETQTFTGVSAVTFNNVFTSTYRNYRYVIDALASSATNTGFQVRVRASGTDLTGGVYGIRRISGTFGSATVNGSAENFNATSINFGNIADTGRAQLSGDIKMPALTQRTHFEYNGFIPQQSDFVWYVGSGQVGNTNAYDGVTFFVGTGTIAGQVSIYGYKD
jgi:hypothetical protein